MKIKAVHRGYSRDTIRRAVAWTAKQIGLEAKHAKRLTIEVGYRRCRMGLGWGGWYGHRERLVQVLLPRDRDHDDWPTSMAHNAEEKLAGRDAHDEWELFVAILAHELEHARCFAIARNQTERKRLNFEPRVRATDWRTLLAFRESRETLLADWLREKPQRQTRPKKSVVEQRAARAEELLADWERRLKLAKTKVSKYRRKVKYYQKRGSNV
jgi:hypothetical protein